jgi:hypothetical protein
MPAGNSPQQGELPALAAEGHPCPRTCGNETRPAGKARVGATAGGRRPARCLRTWRITDGRFGCFSDLFGRGDGKLDSACVARTAGSSRKALLFATLARETPNIAMRPVGSTRDFSAKIPRKNACLHHGRVARWTRSPAGNRMRPLCPRGVPTNPKRKRGLPRLDAHADSSLAIRRAGRAPGSGRRRVDAQADSSLALRVCGNTHRAATAPAATRTAWRAPRSSARASNARPRGGGSLRRGSRQADRRARSAGCG